MVSSLIVNAIQVSPVDGAARHVISMVAIGSCGLVKAPLTLGKMLVVPCWEHVAAIDNVGPNGVVPGSTIDAFDGGNVFDGSPVIPSSGSWCTAADAGWPIVLVVKPPSEGPTHGRMIQSPLAGASWVTENVTTAACKPPGMNRPITAIRESINRIFMFDDAPPPGQIVVDFDRETDPSRVLKES
jgi:hypothetical protein